eukprot:8395543-Karenia_brevis.AAC.1
MQTFFIAPQFIKLGMRKGGNRQHVQLFASKRLVQVIKNSRACAPPPCPRGTSGVMWSGLVPHRLVYDGLVVVL